MRLRAKLDVSPIERMAQRARRLDAVSANVAEKWADEVIVRSKRIWPVKTGYTRRGLRVLPRPAGARLANTASDAAHIWYRGARAWDAIVVAIARSRYPIFRRRLARAYVEYLKSRGPSDGR